MQLEFIPRRPISAACMLVSPGEDRRFVRLSNKTQHIWFDHERQAREFFSALLDGRIDGYHRRLPIYIPDDDILPGLWFYTNVTDVTSNPGVSQNFTFDSTWTTTNLVEVISGGGGGGGGTPNVSFGGGAGGGAYCNAHNLTNHLPNSTTTVHVGAGATGGGSPGGTGNTGGRSWFGGASAGASDVYADGGGPANGINLGAGGTGGQGSIAVIRGGNGAGGTAAAGSGSGGGGGGAGASLHGGDASGQTAGAGGAGALQDGSLAGAGGQGGKGAGNATNGHNYGGGGAGAPTGGGTGLTGAQGVISVAWTVGGTALSALIICG